ncbi:uncharacterized protein LOC120999480 isoform X2 [Bufo bufo]|uniref:uncharacterized protein LOC120999480 isoform X2 n=1 Tax=Bufo bufo TaxID=8384 RepID=UPI001ABDF241|nr:uncharacterized protein LOC120999480 isoform X2 [Bufo bufo]
MEEEEEVEKNIMEEVRKNIMEESEEKEVKMKDEEEDLMIWKRRVAEAKHVLRPGRFGEVSEWPRLYTIFEKDETMEEETKKENIIERKEAPITAQAKLVLTTQDPIKPTRQWWMPKYLQRRSNGKNIRSRDRAEGRRASRFFRTIFGCFGKTSE